MLDFLVVAYFTIHLHYRIPFWWTSFDKFIYDARSGANNSIFFKFLFLSHRFFFRSFPPPPPTQKTGTGGTRKRDEFPDAPCTAGYFLINEAIRTTARCEYPRVKVMIILAINHDLPETWFPYKLTVCGVLMFPNLRTDVPIPESLQVSLRLPVVRIWSKFWNILEKFSPNYRRISKKILKYLSKNSVEIWTNFWKIFRILQKFWSLKSVDTFDTW